MAFDLALRDNGAGTFDLTLSVAGGSTTVTPPETAVAVAANDAAVKVTPVAAEAAVAVAAFDATIRVTDVPAEAAVTVTANDAVIAITAVPAEAPVTVAANDATVSTAAATTAIATEAAVTVTANDATASIAPAPAQAAVTAAANDAAVRIIANAEAALVGVDSPASSTESSSVLAGGNAGNNTSPSLTFPANIQPGQGILVMLMQNNTDVITAVPSELTSLDPITPATGTGAANVYAMIADSGTASSTLTWTLSATRNWAIAWVAISGVEQDLLATVNVLESAADTVTATSSFTTPSATSSDDGFLVEFFGAKADGVALTGLGHPSGFTERFERLASTGTFGSNVSVATRDTNPVASGTYGGDTWTTTSNVTTTFRYTIVLNKTEGVTASIIDTQVFDAGAAITVYPGSADVGVTAPWDSGDAYSTIMIGDNPVPVLVAAYDATVSTATGTTAPATEAACTVTAYDPTIRITAAAGAAAVTVTSHDPALSIRVNADPALVTITAHDLALAAALLRIAAASQPSPYDQLRDLRRRGGAGRWSRGWAVPTQRVLYLEQPSVTYPQGRVVASSDLFIPDGWDAVITDPANYTTLPGSWEAQVLTANGYVLEGVT